MTNNSQGDHGGGLDAVCAAFGGDRTDWLDLSTGINPRAYPVSKFPMTAWTELPDTKAMAGLEAAARQFWQVPNDAVIVCAPGASALIATVPTVLARGTVHIPSPTYNEHAASFAAAGWTGVVDANGADAMVVVQPNNPDGKIWDAQALAHPDRRLLVVDESFCDVAPAASMVGQLPTEGTIFLKSFGKFWGLAGLRLGFAICDRDTASALRAAMGPWPVAGPALAIATQALRDQGWATATRRRLVADAARLREVVTKSGAKAVGGTDLFGLFEVDQASAWQQQLVVHKIWTRIFSYNSKWMRLGLPGSEPEWFRLELALETCA